MAESNKLMGDAKPPGLVLRKVVVDENAPLELALEPSVPRTNFHDYVWLLYGEKKIGKTSLAARFPNAYFFMFEPGGGALRVRQSAIKTWMDFKRGVTAIERDQTGIETVIIDTADIAYDLALQFKCAEVGVEHPTDANDYGKTWGLVESEFKQQMQRLVNAGKGVVFISHAKEAELKTRLHGTFSRTVPTLSNQAARYITGLADILAYYGYFGDDRYLILRGNDNVQAGCRLEENFRLADYAEMDVAVPKGVNAYVAAVPMGQSPNESYHNILVAFNNGQEESFGEVRGVPEMKDLTGVLKQPMGRRG